MDEAADPAPGGYTHRSGTSCRVLAGLWSGPRPDPKALMKIPKPSDDDKAWFRSLVPDDPDVEVKPMFGNLGAFANGNMFMGLFGADVGVKLAGDDRAELEAVDGAGPFGPEERPMAGYVTLPPAWRPSAEQAAPWVGRSLAQARSLPPKQPKQLRAKPAKQAKAAKPT
jgi:TfoX/Sxy family transcriptional regulator of competence genes